MDRWRNEWLNWFQLQGILLLFPLSLRTFLHFFIQCILLSISRSFSSLLVFVSFPFASVCLLCFSSFTQHFDSWGDGAAVNFCVESWYRDVLAGAVLGDGCCQPHPGPIWCTEILLGERRAHWSYPLTFWYVLVVVVCVAILPCSLYLHLCLPSFLCFHSCLQIFCVWFVTLLILSRISNLPISLLIPISNLHQPEVPRPLLHLSLPPLLFRPLLLPPRSVLVLVRACKVRMMVAELVLLLWMQRCRTIQYAALCLFGFSSSWLSLLCSFVAEQFLQDQELLKKYIVYAKQNCSPKLTTALDQVCCSLR